VVTALDLRNAIDVLVLGKVPAEWHFEAIEPKFDVVVRLVDESSSLATHVRSDKPRILAVFVGEAEEGGFLRLVLDMGTPEFVPDEWWETGGRELHLFAFSCWSAEYLSRQSIHEKLHGAIAYSEWLFFTPLNGSLWLNVLDTIRDRMRLSGAADIRLFGHIQGLYSDLLLSHRGSLDYLTQLCLIQQSSALRLLPGLGL
jgi:hypothetical protein